MVWEVVMGTNKASDIVKGINGIDNIDMDLKVLNDS